MIVSLATRPDLVETVADWLWAAFRRDGGKTYAQLLAAVRVSTEGRAIPQTFVLLEDGKPVGTAGLIAHDLDARPALSPWLAAVYVVPDARGRGHAMTLVRAVEGAAIAASVGRLWLYTGSAEGLYLKAGWQTEETMSIGGRPYALMLRDLRGAP